jgi:hypothetical protein
MDLIPFPHPTPSKALQLQPAYQANEADPNHMPEATSPATSEPCSASTRGLPRLFRSTIAPSSVSTKPVNRLLFFVHSPPALPRRAYGRKVWFTETMTIQVQGISDATTAYTRSLAAS